MSSLIVGESYDLLLKMVVIGGIISLIQIREWGRLIFFQGFRKISSAFNRSLLSAYNSQLKLSPSKITKSKYKSGTLPDNKDSEQSPMRTIKEPPEPSLYLTSQEDRLLKISLNG